MQYLSTDDSSLFAGEIKANLWWVTSGNRNRRQIKARYAFGYWLITSVMQGFGYLET